jgi:hypothetical protein
MGIEDEEARLFPGTAASTSPERLGRDCILRRGSANWSFLWIKHCMEKPR